MADHLANEGVNLIMGYLDRALETSPSDILIVDCHTLAQGDLVSLDGTWQARNLDLFVSTLIGFMLWWTNVTLCIYDFN